MKNTPTAAKRAEQKVPPWAATAAAAVATTKAEAFLPGSGKAAPSRIPLLAPFFSAAVAEADVSILGTHSPGWQP